MTPEISLIIFDCDGTLVDTEYLNCFATAEALRELGYSKYTTDYVREYFAARAMSDIKAEIEAETNAPVSDFFIPRHLELVAEHRPKLMRIIAGALETVAALEAQGYLTCVGSNGERQNVLSALTACDFRFTDERIFTKVQVKNPKPAPDLFLFAAEKMGVKPENCLVVEDSPVGVRAGKAAGMQVIGFPPTYHDVERQAVILKDAGADHIIYEFIHIHDVLRGKALVK